MDSIVIGRKFGYKFWNWLLKRARKRVEFFQSKVQKTQQETLRIYRVMFPSTTSCIIKFERLSDGKKFESIMQGNFSEHYKESEEENFTNDENFKKIVKKRYLDGKYYQTN